jgi:hypothetical protein
MTLAISALTAPLSNFTLPLIILAAARLVSSIAARDVAGRP